MRRGLCNHRQDLDVQALPQCADGASFLWWNMPFVLSTAESRCDNAWGTNASITTRTARGAVARLRCV